MLDVGLLWLAAVLEPLRADDQRAKGNLLLSQNTSLSISVCLHTISVAHFTVYRNPFFFSCRRCHFKVPFIMRNICTALSLLALPGLVEIIIFNGRQTNWLRILQHFPANGER